MLCAHPFRRQRPQLYCICVPAERAAAARGSKRERSCRAPAARQPSAAGHASRPRACACAQPAPVCLIFALMLLLMLCSMQRYLTGHKKTL